VTFTSVTTAPCESLDGCKPPAPGVQSFATPASGSSGNGAPQGAVLPSTTSKPPPKPLTRAQKLAKALKACKKLKKKKKREACVKQAKKKYGAKKASKKHGGKK
jgi:hypothetical protein